MTPTPNQRADGSARAAEPRGYRTVPICRRFVVVRHVRGPSARRDAHRPQDICSAGVLYSYCTRTVNRTRLDY